MNGRAAASDALWAVVSVITCAGESLCDAMWARHAAGLAPATLLANA